MMRKRNFLKGADKLRNDALYALGSIYVGCGTKSKHGYDALGFSIDNDCSRWCEIIWLDRQWWLVERGTNNLTSPFAISVDELCQIVDDILNKFNR